MMMSSGSRERTKERRGRGEIHEMTEASRDHELKSFGSAGRISSDHRVSCHDGRDGSVPRIKRLGGDLESSGRAKKKEEGSARLEINRVLLEPNPALESSNSP